MKKIVLLIIVTCLFLSSAQGQNLIDFLKIDTVELYHYSIIIKHPVNFYKKETSLEYGGRSISYASQLPISFISIIEAANTEMDFGKNCVITDKTEMEHHYTEKGVCALKGYYRSDYYKGTRIIISYESVPECELSLFDNILDSVIIKR